ncbi:exo-rhamnogalacturonan lyase family protein [Massilia varians]
MSISSPTRRRLIQGAFALTTLPAMPFLAQAATANRGGRAIPVSETALQWLDGAPPARFEGATVGVPWPRGTVKADTAFQLLDGERAVPVQSWPTAYWPDGSLKWSAHAVPAGVSAKMLRLRPGRPATPAHPVVLQETTERIIIRSGDLEWIVPRTGSNLIESAARTGRVTMRELRLAGETQDQPDLDATGGLRRQRFTSKLNKVTVEQRGPVRAVLKLEGMHSGEGREWLPFSVRLYFHAGAESVRIVHSFVFDGDPSKDFIRALGVTAKVPLTDAAYDRHVRLSGEDVGVWAEAVLPVTGLRRDPGKPYREAQIAGRALPPLEGMAKAVREGLKWVPQWGDVSLSQANADGFTIRKRVGAGHPWIDSNSGHRTKGIAYVGGAAGGVAVGLKDFWQRTPTGLDIRGAHTAEAELTAWLWSPAGGPMDLRPYRDATGLETVEHQMENLNITYEDYEPGWDTPVGIASTSELTLWVLGSTPTNQVFSDMATQVAAPARPVLAPERIHQAGVFGDWDVADSSTPGRKLLETRLTYQLEQYMREVEQRRWYGFWNFGDIMHDYDADRHMWRYDIGGFAWDNSELATDLWLWYSYLRTGRADVFRFAEAMTRHTGEVDVYHLGRFKGFGTRHGVTHWSDSSKQPRVSNAAYRRIYYFLTADERAGDLMHDLLHVDHDLARINISRKLKKDPDGNTPAGMVDTEFGMVWGSIAPAWLTEWERTGDRRWRDRLLAGMDSIAALPHRWFAASAPYDPKTGRFTDGGRGMRFSSLNGAFGIGELNSELLTLIDAPKYRKAWLEYSRYYNAPAAELVKHLGTEPKGRSLVGSHSRITAYAAYHEADRKLALRAWSEFFSEQRYGGVMRTPTHIAGPSVLRPIIEETGYSTNGAVTWGLAAIQNMALIGDTLDEAARTAGLLR